MKLRDSKHCGDITVAYLIVNLVVSEAIMMAGLSSNPHLTITHANECGILFRGFPPAVSDHIERHA